MTDWTALTARAGRAGHDLVGWLMWDPDTIARYEALGVPNGAGWLLAWRIAPLGDISPAAAAAATYSVHPAAVEFVMGLYRGVADTDAICAVRNESVIPGLEAVAPGLPDQLAPLTDDLWRGVDAVHHGARPDVRRAPSPTPALARRARAVRLVGRQLPARAPGRQPLGAVRRRRPRRRRGRPAALGDGRRRRVRRRGVDRSQPRQRRRRRSTGWARLEAKGLATDRALNDAGRQFRVDLERRTNELTAPAWQAVGEATTLALCDAVDAHHDALLDRIDATAGPRWMPAARQRATRGLD